MVHGGLFRDASTHTHEANTKRMREKEGEKISKILFKKLPTKETVRLNREHKDKSEMKKKGKTKEEGKG